jgi:hypothetical protein
VNEDTPIRSRDPTIAGFIILFIVMLTAWIDIEDWIELLTKIWLAEGIERAHPLFTDERQDKLDIVVKSKF